MSVSAPAQSSVLAPGVLSAAASPGGDVLRALGVVAGEGLGGAEVLRRQAQFGPNAVATHRARVFPVLWHQLRSPLLGLLVGAAVASFLVGQRSDAVIIGLIVGASVGMGFVNEYRAEKAAEALHSQIHHQTVAVRGGRAALVDVTALVPGDVVELRLGDIVPADLRLVEVTGLECDDVAACAAAPPASALPCTTHRARLPDGPASHWVVTDHPAARDRCGDRRKHGRDPGRQGTAVLSEAAEPGDARTGRGPSVRAI
ncbi:cation-transporting P-type ATPase [Streptomyces sp. NPDC001100]